LGGAGGTIVVVVVEVVVVEVVVVEVVGTGGPVVVVVGGGVVVVVVVEQPHWWSPVPSVVPVPYVPWAAFTSPAGWVEFAGCSTLSRWMTVEDGPSAALHAAPPTVTLNAISPTTEASMTISRFTVTSSLPSNRIRSQ
jgi:hypothetical protein